MINLKRLLPALFAAVFLLLSFQPASAFADQPENSFMEDDGNFYIYFEDCTYVDSMKKEAPDEYGWDYYSDPVMYDIYVSNDHKLFRISMETYEALPSSAYCAFEEEIPVPVNSSYCCYAEGVLWVGEFQYGGDYKTDASHYVKTADGLQRAWTCGYRMDAEQDFSKPDYILSVTERIQGITTVDGKIYLSQSYGRRADSLIFKYENVLTREADSAVEIAGESVPMWFLDSGCREDALLSPPMSECLCAVDGDIYVLFESAAQPYMDPSSHSANPMDRVFRLADY